jgi:hypothetical protein
MGATVLSKEQIDLSLEKLGQDGDRIAESLMEMDSHAGHQLLRGAALTGTSATRWAETSTAMTTLWDQFATYKSFLERAREVRARRSRPGEEELAELTELLSGPVVELNAQQVPIERRSLTGPSTVIDRITLTELVERMNKTFSQVTEVLATAETAWSDAIGQLDALAEELTATTELADSIAAGDRTVAATLNRIRRRIDDVRELAITDMLSLDAGADPLPEMAAELTELRARLESLAEIRDTFDDRLGMLDLALSDVEALETTARQTYTAVQQKIASPGLPEPTDAVSRGLRGRLRELAGKRARGDWPRLAVEADALADAAANALESARRTLGAMSGLFDRRAELRGRLEAYRVKAARIGFAEDLELERRHQEAQELLFTAPCDLAAATRALNRYQQAIQQREREGDLT